MATILTDEQLESHNCTSECDEAFLDYLAQRNEFDQMESEKSDSIYDVLAFIDREDY